MALFSLDSRSAIALRLSYMKYFSDEWSRLYQKIATAQKSKT